MTGPGFRSGADDDVAAVTGIDAAAEYALMSADADTYVPSDPRLVDLDDPTWHRPRFRPTDLPELRWRIVADSARVLPAIFADTIVKNRQHIYPPSMLARWRAGQSQSAGSTGLEMAAAEITRLAEAELFYVAPDMTALAITAGADLPSFTFGPDVLPAPTGLIVFDGPPLLLYDEPTDRPDMPLAAYVVAIAWGPLGPAPTVRFPGGTWFSAYTDRDLTLPHDDIPGRRVSPPLLYDNEFIVHDNVDTDTVRAQVADRDTVARIIPSVLSAFLMMREPFVADVHVTADRPARRRLARDGHPHDTTVRVVRLRHRAPTQRAESDDDGTPRVWSHQWMVSGHWRRQWYPSAGQHRPKYIHPYAKGPADAPMLVRDTVHVWDR